MRRALLIAALGLLVGGCMAKDEAPMATQTSVGNAPAAPAPAEDVSERWAEEAPAPEKASVKQVLALDEEAPADDQVDDLLGALGGDGAPRREPPDPVALPRAQAEPPPPPPPPPTSKSVALAAPGFVDGKHTITLDGDSPDVPMAGLGLRGSGEGGGGQGFGRIRGMGEVDTGGGKGRGPAQRAMAGKKEKKKVGRLEDRRKVRRSPAKPKPQLEGFGERTKEEAQSELLFDAFADDDRELEPDEPAEEEEQKELADESRFRNRRDATTRHGWTKNDRAQRGGEFETMLDKLDEKDVDGRFWQVAEYPDRFVAPPRFIPRMCYFENTYLGGNAAYTERLRRLDDALPRRQQPYRAAALPRQPFDAPDDAGLALTATLDRPYVDQPQRVFLQVGLQGSKRFGWRRPPLDIALVVDATARDGELLVEAITALSRRLGPQDRLGVVLAGPRPEVLGELAPLRDRLVLARAIEALGSPPAAHPGALAGAMRQAGDMLQKAAGDSARIPGTQTVLVLTREANPVDVEGARGVAHTLTVQGAVTSVIQLGGSHQGWWQVANAGHGNYHRVEADALTAAVDDELGSIARVIARLLRINVKLAKGVEAIRVVGSRVLGQEEVKQVKAREEATDRNLSKTMGVKADRGDDDDGIQTVIPYFYGGDSHVILLELWVTRPGAVAEVTLKYKDMVALQNATARVAAEVDRVPRDLTPAERRVAANVRGFQVAEGLATAADYAARGNTRGALSALDALEPLALGGDRELVDAFEDLVSQRADGTVAEALRMAHDRRIGHSP